MLYRDFVGVVPRFCGCCTEIVWVLYLDFACLGGDGGVVGFLAALVVSYALVRVGGCF